MESIHTNSKVPKLILFASRPSISAVPTGLLPRAPRLIRAHVALQTKTNAFQGVDGALTVR